MPRDIPIIFSGAMVRALLDGRKTMTRRLAWNGRKAADGQGFMPSPWQKVRPGDRLYVRESLHADRMENFLTGERSTNAMVAYYNADDAEAVSHDGFNLAWKWDRKSLPSIHMPRSFSRLTLVITATKREPLQSISAADARAEGCELFVPGHGWIEKKDLAEGYSNYLDARAGFEDIWRTLHGDESWDANPEVVALSSRVIRANIDAPEARAA